MVRKKKQQQRPGYNKPVLSSQPGFEGACKGLKGHIYDCLGNRQYVLFVTTTKAVATYAEHNYKYGGDIRSVIEKLELPTFEYPQDPPPDASKTEELLWEKQVDDVYNRKTHLSQNLGSLYWLLWGQCTYFMQQNLQALDKFKAISNDSNGLALLKAIKEIVYELQTHKYLPQVLHKLLTQFYLFSQDSLTNAVYLDQFQSLGEAIVNCGGSIGGPIGVHPRMVKDLATEKGVDMATCDLNKLKQESQERYLAVAFLLGADRARYGQLIVNLENGYLLGRNNYPKTVDEAYSLLTNWDMRSCRY